MNFFRRYRVQILVCVLAAFLIPIAFNFGQLAGLKGAPTDTVAEVNGDNIPFYIFTNFYERALSQLSPADQSSQEARNKKKEEALRDLITSTVMEQQAKKFGIEVPDAQVVSSLANVQAFQQNGRFSPEAYQRALAYQLKMTPKDFEAEQRRQIAIYKLSWLIRSAVKVTDKEFELALPVLGPQIKQQINVSSAASKKPAAPTAAEIRDRVAEENVAASMNEWYGALNHTIKVKLHPEVLQEVK